MACGIWNDEDWERLNVERHNVEVRSSPYFDVGRWTFVFDVHPAR